MFPSAGSTRHTDRVRRVDGRRDECLLECHPHHHARKVHSTRHTQRVRVWVKVWVEKEGEAVPSETINSVEDQSRYAE
jgi:hypothetical protein